MRFLLAAGLAVFLLAFAPGCDSDSGGDDPVPEIDDISVNATRVDSTQLEATISNGSDVAVTNLQVFYRLRQQGNPTVLGEGVTSLSETLEPGESATRMVLVPSAGDQWNCYEYTLQLIIPGQEVLSEDYLGTCS